MTDSDEAFLPHSRNCKQTLLIPPYLTLLHFEVVIFAILQMREAETQSDDISEFTQLEMKRMRSPQVS